MLLLKVRKTNVSKLFFIYFQSFANCCHGFCCWVLWGRCELPWHPSDRSDEEGHVGRDVSQECPPETSLCLLARIGREMKGRGKGGAGKAAAGELMEPMPSMSGVQAGKGGRGNTTGVLCLR